MDRTRRPSNRSVYSCLPGTSSYPVPLFPETLSYALWIFDEIPVYPIIVLWIAGFGLRVPELERPLPELDGNDDALFVATSIIHILDFVHCIFIASAKEYSFSQ